MLQEVTWPKSFAHDKQDMEQNLQNKGTIFDSTSPVWEKYSLLLFQMYSQNPCQL